SSLLEPDVDGEEDIVPAQIDFRVGAARESFTRRQIPFPTLVSILEAQAHIADRHAHTAEDDGTHRRSGALKAVLKNVVLVVDEVACLHVAPTVDADAAANVWRNGIVMAERQVADRRRDRDDTELEILFDGIAVRELEKSVNGGRGP